MLCVELFMLVILELEPLKMVGYFESYAMFKFDDEICLCCVCPCWYELMKMMVVLLMYSVRWTPWYVVCEFWWHFVLAGKNLETCWRTRPNPNFFMTKSCLIHKAAPCMFFWCFLAMWRISVRHAGHLERRVSLKGPGNYKFAIPGPHVSLNDVCFQYLFQFDTSSYKIHNSSILNPNFMGFFASCSSQSLVFYHIFSRFFWWVDFNWY